MSLNRWYTGSIQKFLLICWIAILLPACGEKQKLDTLIPAPTVPASTPAAVPGGIEKPGNTCYAISALQLWATATIEGDNIFSGSHINNLDKEEKKELAKAGDEIIKKINKGETVEENEMKGFYEKLRACEWKRSIEGVEDLNELMEHIYGVLSPGNSIKVVPSNNLIIGSRCPTEPYILPLSLPENDDAVSMQTLFSSFLGTNVKSFKEIPNLLTLYVPRNFMGRKQKNKITNPLTITITAVRNAEEHTYDLVAFAKHCDDGTAASGHYIAHVKRGNQWFQCTDGEIRKCDKIAEVTDSAGGSDMYLYKKRD